MTPFILAICAVVIVFLAIILIRTAMFRPKKDITERSYSEITLDSDKIISDMSDMIKCKTVSYRDFSLEDKGEFEKFEKLLAERFPLIHKTAELKKIGRNGLLYFIKGESSQKPSVCMAHYDVVPVEEDLWTKPAFDGLVEDGFIWGRGTLDTKGTLCGVMEALEMLLSKGYVPKNDLYLSFSGEEETDGDSCCAIVAHLKEKGTTPAIVLDEGGAVVDNVFPGVKERCALIGIAEKGGVNIDFSLKSSGGHSSTPPASPVTARVCKAVCRLQKKPFRRRLTKAAAELFDTLGRRSSLLYRLIFSNLWCFFPLLDLIATKTGGEINAMIRSTAAVTKLSGSNAYNVLPPKAGFGVNLRLMDGDSIEDAVNYIRKVTKEKDAEITVVSGTEASPCSDTDNPEWDSLTLAIRETWNDAIVSPYLMMACSDSRHYCDISDRVYRFSAMYLSKEERGMIHGNDERIPVDTLLKTVEFYVRFLEKL